MKETLKIMKETKAFIPLSAGTLWSLITGGILTAAVVLTAMLFMIYLLRSSRPSVCPAQPPNQAPSGLNPNPSFSSQPRKNSGTAIPVGIPTNVSLSRTPQTETAYKSGQNTQDRKPFPSATETPSFGNNVNISAGAFEKPDGGQ